MCKGIFVPNLYILCFIIKVPPVDLDLIISRLPVLLPLHRGESSEEWLQRRKCLWPQHSRLPKVFHSFYWTRSQSNQSSPRQEIVEGPCGNWYNQSFIESLNRWWLMIDYAMMMMTISPSLTHSTLLSQQSTFLRLRCYEGRNGWCQNVWQLKKTNVFRPEQTQRARPAPVSSIRSRQKIEIQTKNCSSMKK